MFSLTTLGKILQFDLHTHYVNDIQNIIHIEQNETLLKEKPPMETTYCMILTWHNNYCYLFGLSLSKHKQSDRLVKYFIMNWIIIIMI